MHFTKLTLALASLLLTASSAPVASPDVEVPEAGFIYTAGPRVSTSEEGAAVKKRAINDCGDSTFINQSSGGSPSVNDCWTLYNNIAGDGTWTVWGPNHHTIATYGSCAFGVTVGGVGFAYIGNGDIRDLVRDSINKFQWNGLVGSKGDMHCQGLGNPAVSWGLYHT